MAATIQGYTDDDIVLAIEVNDELYWVGDDIEHLEDEPKTDQCDACGGWRIVRDGNHYVCSECDLNGELWPGCGATYFPEYHAVRQVVMP